MNRTFFFSVAFAAVSFFACNNTEATSETDSSSSGISKRSSSGNSANSGKSSSSAGNSSASSSSGENSDYSSSGENSSESGDSSSDDGNSSQSGNSSSSGGNSSQGGNSSSSTTSSSSRASASSSSSSNSSSSSSSSSPLPSSSSYPKLQKGGAGVLEGWASRYWDGCKPHCSWLEQVDATAKPFSICRNCNSDNQEIPAFTLSPNVQEYWTGYEGTKSSCEQGGIAFTCFDMAPLKINETLSYAFAAAPGTNAACGKCYQVQFDGGNHSNDVKEAHRLIKDKTLIILASNIGHDVAGGQFDILIPGGGVGNFDSFSSQLGVSKEDLGVRDGGFLSTCQQSLGWDIPAARYKECVAKKCNDIFGKDPKFADLLRGCLWFADWYEAADNPTLLYKEVQCPQYLADKYISTINTEPDTKIEPKGGFNNKLPSNYETVKWTW